MIAILNLLGLLINFIGSYLMYKGAPKINVNAITYSDGGEFLNKQYNKKIKKGLFLFCIGFAIQFITSFYALLQK